MEPSDAAEGLFILKERKKVKTTKRVHIADVNNELDTSNKEDIDLEVVDRIFTKVRVEYNSTTNSTFDMYEQASKIVTMLKEVDTTLRLVSMVNKRNKIASMEELEGKKQFEEFFSMEDYFMESRKMGQIHIIFQIESSLSITEMKLTSVNMSEKLVELGAWLKAHTFATNRIVSAGFITKKHTSLTNRVDYENNLTTLIRESIRSNNNIPSLQREKLISEVYIEVNNKVIINNNKVTDGKGKEKITTLALEVKTDTKNKEIIIETLTKLKLCEIKYGKYCPYDMLKTDNELFNAILIENNKYLEEFRMIPINGVHIDVLNTMIKSPVASRLKVEMVSIRELMCSPHYDEADTEFYPIHSIERNTKSVEYGKWFVITTKENYETAKEMLENSFETLCKTSKEYELHLNDNENYRKGIITIKKNRSEDYNEYAEYMRSNMSVDVSPSKTNKRHQTPTNKRKKFIVYTYKSEDFPNELEAASNKSKTTKKWGTTSQQETAGTYSSASSVTSYKTTASISTNKAETNSNIDRLEKLIAEQGKMMIDHTTRLVAEVKEELIDHKNETKVNVDKLTRLIEILMNQVKHSWQNPTLNAGLGIARLQNKEYSTDLTIQNSSYNNNNNINSNNNQNSNRQVGILQNNSNKIVAKNKRPINNINNSTNNNLMDITQVIDKENFDTENILDGTQSKHNALNNSSFMDTTAFEQFDDQLECEIDATDLGQNTLNFSAIENTDLQQNEQGYDQSKAGGHQKSDVPLCR